ncbi:hypothetical protein D3H41_09275 [Vibrio neocaledonicus]|nr:MULTISPECIES: hypothetical protein [Vibrio harveyi group]QCO87642.1 hypothetical protein D3H41_09275 [Vibrio neocaledonicus]
MVLVITAVCSGFSIALLTP